MEDEQELIREFKAYFDVGEVRAGSRTVEASLSSEYPYEREAGKEVLLHGPDNIDLSRGDLPLLLQHDSSKINIGLAKDLRIENRKLKATLKFGRSKNATEVWEDVKSGILKFISVAYSVIRKTSTDSDGRYHVTRWRPYEASLVSVAADPTVGVNRSGNLQQTTNKRRVEEMSEKDQEEIRAFFDESNFETTGEFFQAIYKQGVGGSYSEDPDVKRAASGLSVTGDGIITPEGFPEKILFGRWSSPIIKKLLSLRVSENVISLPYATSQNRANGYFDSLRTYQVAESDEKPKSKPKLAALEYKLKKTATLAYVTDELVEDSNLLDKFLTHTFSIQLNYDLLRQLEVGNGHNEWLGLIHAPGRVRQDKIGGQTAGSLVAENIEAMWARLLPECHSTAIWRCSPTALESLLQMGRAVGTGGSVVRHLTYGPDGMALMGRPLSVSPFLNSIGNEGDIVVFSPEYYLFCQRKEDPKQTVSMHLNYIYDESCYRLTFRSDGMPIQSQPTVYSAGGTGYSSIVVLKTRS